MRHHYLLTLLVLAGGVVFADDNLDESKTIEKIELIGGNVTRNETLPDRPVVGVSFEGSKRFNDKYIHLLGAFPNLVKLDVTGCEQITDLSLVNIRQLNGLKALVLVGTKVTDAGLNAFRDHPNLCIVDLFDTGVAESGLAILRASLPNFDEEATVVIAIERLGGSVTRDDQQPGCPVVEVNLGRNHNPMNKYLYLLRSLPHLSHLNLKSNTISMHEMAAICQCNRLTSLDLSYSSIADEDLGGIDQLKNLTIFDLAGTKITVAGLRQLGQLNQLTTLNLARTQLTDSDFKGLTGLRHLSDLNLFMTQISDVSLQRLTEFPNLTKLNLSSTKITDAGMAELNKLESLSYLILTNTQISNVGLKEFAKIKTLTVVDLSKSKVTDAGVAELKKSLPNLQIIR